MKRYEIYVAGERLYSYNSREDAEKALNEAKNSFLALVHPKECFYIKEVEQAEPPILFLTRVSRN